MRAFKTYLLHLFTLLCVLSGAAMPYLASRVQDMQTEKLRQTLTLATVDLTLRQETDIGLALRILSQGYKEIYLSGDETSILAGDAYGAAEEAVMELDRYDLLPREIADHLPDTGQVEPHMLVAEDGSSILVWDCSWEMGKRWHCSATVDDTTGKLIRASISCDFTDGKMAWEEAAFLQLEKWTAFIQDYYSVMLIDVNDITVPMDDNLRFYMRFASEDDDAFYDLSLDVGEDLIFFNYQQMMPKGWQTDDNTRTHQAMIGLS